jgi:uncharacterized protein YfaT (DUF1175 family)
LFAICSRAGDWVRKHPLKARRAPAVIEQQLSVIDGRLAASWKRRTRSSGAYAKAMALIAGECAYREGGAAKHPFRRFH